MEDTNTMVEGTEEMETATVEGGEEQTTTEETEAAA